MSKSIWFLQMIFVSTFFFSCHQNQQSPIQKEKETIKPVLINTVPKSPALEKSEVSLHRISSKILGYDLQYWVHLPEGYQIDSKYPTLYVTDGLWYKDEGELPIITDQLIKENKMESIITIFVDAIDPDNSQKKSSE